MIQRLRPGLKFDVVSNPEFLRAGCAVGDFKNPDRVVIGAESKRAKAVLAGVYVALGIDDRLRDAPAIALAETLIEEGASIHAYDPVGMARAAPLLPASVRYHATALEAARRADVLVVVTKWDEFRQLDLVRLKREMATPLLVDLRNMFSEEHVTRLGFAYCGIGHQSAWHDPAVLPETSRISALPVPAAARIGRRNGLLTAEPLPSTPAE